MQGIEGDPCIWHKPHGLSEREMVMKRIGTFLAALMACLSLASPQSRAADPALSPTANAAFLAANSHKAGVVVRPSGLQYEILKNGFGKRPRPTDTVTVNYTGMLINGKVFDGTEPLTPAQYEAPATAGYLDAFAKLEASDQGALAAFAAHVGKHPDDQLAGFHLKRLLNGATGTRIAMD